MADAPAFDFVCSEIEQGSSLGRLEARGTVRIALKQAGLDAQRVEPDQMKVVVEKILPGELSTRGVADGDALCGRIVVGLAHVDSSGTNESPEAVFARLGGNG